MYSFFMASDSINLFDAVLALPESQRAELVHRLLESLESTSDGPDETEEAWSKMIQERMAIVERGDFEAVEWTDAVSRIREALAKRADG
jgi:hypothetical protein